MMRSLLQHLVFKQKHYSWFWKSGLILKLWSCDVVKFDQIVLDLFRISLMLLLAFCLCSIKLQFWWSHYQLRHLLIHGFDSSPKSLSCLTLLSTSKLVCCTLAMPMLGFYYYCFWLNIFLSTGIASEYLLNLGVFICFAVNVQLLYIYLIIISQIMEFPCFCCSWLRIRPLKLSLFSRKKKKKRNVVCNYCCLIIKLIGLCHLVKSF